VTQKVKSNYLHHLFFILKGKVEVLGDRHLIGRRNEVLKAFRFARREKKNLARNQEMRRIKAARRIVGHKKTIGSRQAIRFNCLDGETNVKKKKKKKRRRRRGQRWKTSWEKTFLKRENYDSSSWGKKK
jgi:hypothetical protein